MKKLKKLLALAIVCAIALSSVAASAEDSFAEKIESSFAHPDINYRGEVRWWMAEAGHTDETIVSEITAMHDAGFRGMELCQQVDTSIDEETYGYGSPQWDHDLALAMNTALDLGMTVSLTSGTNWATANIPGLDPASQAAEQIIFDIVEYIKPGNVREGTIPMSKKVGGAEFGVEESAKLVGIFAVPQVSGNKASPITTDSTGIVELTNLATKQDDGTITLDWMPENPESKYRIFYYWQQGAAQEAHPASKKAYCINYFDEAGVTALKDYWEAHILNDESLNSKIAAGDVQLFMDSLEINTGNGCAFWCDDMAEQFQARKGYDIRPYLYLTIGLPGLSFWDAADHGTYDLDGQQDLRGEILNDLFDVQTQLYQERMLEPLREWLHGYGIKTRAQISYGQRLEISQPITSVDYPEAEVLNQNNQIDIYRIWAGGAKLENKVLSAEAGAYGGYNYTYQDHLMEAYNLFAAGFSRIIWHVWTAQYGPGENRWPNYKVPGAIYSNFYSFGTHEPSSTDYPAFNDHLARISQLLQTGVSRTDVGMPYINYQQTTPTMGNHGGENWMLNHTAPLFPSTKLQNAGFTYDYFNPAFLTSDDVHYDSSTDSLEKAGYKTIVLWQKEMTCEGAEALLKMAKDGLKIVIVDGAASATPFNDGKDDKLKSTIAEIAQLPNAVTAASADDVLASLQMLGVEPYCGYIEPNRQLLTQTRRDGDYEYIYAYNYCDGSYIPYWSKGECTDTHGNSISTELSVEGTWIPYEINSWTGAAEKICEYRHENGRTNFKIALDAGNVALFALEKVQENSQFHAVATDCDKVISLGDTIAAVVTESGKHSAELSDGTDKEFAVEIPEKFEIADWDVEFSLWSPSDEVKERTETLLGSTITETQVQTVENKLSLHLPQLQPWDEIPEVGVDAVGKATYKANFTWDGAASGAYLDLGSIIESADVYVNGTRCGDLSMTKPVIDISRYLVVGSNNLEIIYSSNLSNHYNSSDNGDWYGYRYGKHHYGICEASIIPYVTVQLN